MSVDENGLPKQPQDNPTTPAQTPLLTSMSFWSDKPKSLTADKHLELILGSVTRLPLQYWKKNYFFTSASDDMLYRLSEGNFPARRVPDKRHPILTLKALPDRIGFQVCPCTSRKPYDKSTYRYVQKGCILHYTAFQMDRNSFILEWLRLNIPASLALEVRFRGRVPDDCIQTA